MKKLFVLLSILIFTTIIVSCNRHGIGNFRTDNAKNLPMKTEKTNDKQIKRINLQTVSFSTPEGFTDKSLFFFSKKEANEGYGDRLDVEHLVRNEQTKNIEVCRAAVYKKAAEWKNAGSELLSPPDNAATQSNIFLDKEITVGENYQTLLVGWEKRVGSDVENQMEAFIFDTPTTLFRLKYQTTGNGERKTENFERIVASAEIVTSDFAENYQITDDFIRRFAGDLTLEVPSELVPRREFVYEKYGVPDPTDKEFYETVKLTLLDPDNREKMERLYVKDKREIDPKYFDGEVKDTESLSVETKFFTGKTEKYFTTVNKPYEKINPSLVYRTVTLLGRFRDKSENKIILIGQAPNGREKELESDSQKWFDTFIPASEGSGNN